MKNYENEAREHEQKTKNYAKEDWTQANDGLMAILNTGFLQHKV